MKLTTLSAHDVSSEVIEAWRQKVGDDLLPIQAEAVKAGLFLGHNLVVLSPTSSGKTFVGEMAATRAARADQKVFYLVSHKAIAEEKFRDFEERYAHLDIETVISTRDRREFDSRIENGEFHVAIVVFEKLQSLLVGRPELLHEVGLVVVDELQVICDEQRGADLEILLTKIRRSPAQIVGLSAVLGNAQPLARWLGARLISTEARPVELQKGVCCRGRFTYREHNSGKTGTEQIGVVTTRDHEQHLVGTIASLAAFEPVLVFVPDRPSSREVAEAISAATALPPAKEVLEEILATEDARAAASLAVTLEHGVAFHNSDLTPALREILERGFRSGKIRVLVATSTLATGVNLPVKNVVIAKRWRWRYFKPLQKWIRAKLTTSEFENMAGRAGRLGLAEGGGRAMLVTPSRWDQANWMRDVVSGAHDDVEPTLKNQHLVEVVANLLASHLCGTENQITEFLLESFTGAVYWRPSLGLPAFRGQVHDAVSELAKHHLLTRHPDGTLTISEVGRVAALRGMSVRSVMTFSDWATKARLADFTPLEVLFVASLTPDGQQGLLRLSTAEHSRGDYVNRTIAVIRELRAERRPAFAYVIANPGRLSYERVKGLKKALLLHEWIEEGKVEALEKDHNVYAGAIHHLATDFAWLVEAQAEIGEILGWPVERTQQLRQIAARLRHGVRPDLLPLARLDVPGLGRTYLRRLADAGILAAEQARDASADTLLVALRNRGAVARLRGALELAQVLPLPLPAASNPIGDSPAESERCAPEAHVDDLPRDCALGAPEILEPAVLEPAPAEPEQPAQGKRAPRLRFTRRYDKKRCWIELDGKVASLSPALFVLLLRIALGRLRSEAWVHKVDLGAKGYGWNLMSRLRKELKRQLGDAVLALIENDGDGRYRLALSADEIELVLAELAEHLSHDVRDAIADLNRAAAA